MNKEIWKKIDNTIYECSNLGRFRRIGKTKINYLKPYFRNCYENKRNRPHTLIVKMKIDDKFKEFNCNKTIAELFIRPLQPNEVVVCKNGDRSDIRVSNLFITTKSQLGKITGHKTSKSKKVYYFDNTGYRQSFRSARECAKQLGVSYQTILDYCHNRVENPKYNVQFVDKVDD